jgi:hypothetical protein
MNLKRPAHLPLAARLLAHKSPEVRTLTAQAVSSFGSAAKRYIPDLRQAVAVETNEITRKTLEGAIEKISKSKQIARNAPRSKAHRASRDTRGYSISCRQDTSTAA